MISRDDLNHCGAELETILKLATAPIAVKMLESEADIPEGALRPERDYGHLAQCQAFALSRRDGATVAMLSEDHWCPGPLISYGLVPPSAPGHLQHDECDRFEYGKYIGILTAPLKTASFIPDVVIMYPNVNQLSNLLCAIRPEDQSRIKSHYFAPSCVYSVVTPIITGEYQLVIPDQGEYVRALSQPGEIMFAIPQCKLTDLVADLKRFQSQFPKLVLANVVMRPDYPLPEIYKKAFDGWGLHQKM